MDAVRYHVAITFEADNIEQAEDYAAHVQDKATADFTRYRRVALYYTDPISGNSVLWAEPVMSAEQLAARRNHGSS